MRTYHSSKNIIILITIFLSFSLCTILPLPWNDLIVDLSIDLQFKTRGKRSASEKIALVFIGDKDIKTLGGWPISRDYYSYAIHILQSKEARVIGLDVLFTKPDFIHPEYDRILSDFIESAGNICLPLSFSELQLKTTHSKSNSFNFPNGKGITESLHSFINSSAANGFSNIERKSTIRKAPLIAEFNNDFIYSFGLQLARLYLNNQNFTNVNTSGLALFDNKQKKFTIPVDTYGRLRLNHFGDLENIEAISLLDLFQDFRKKSNQIDLKDKLVIIAVTGSGISTIKTTPLSDSLPASLIHATIAENCLQQNFLVEILFIWKWLIIAIFILAAYSILKFRKHLVQLELSLGFLIAYFSISIVFFAFMNIMIPVFYPLLAFITTAMILSIERKRHQNNLDTSITILLNDQINKKESELEKTKNRLASLELELNNKTQLTEQTLQVAKERKDSIFQLEKGLNDLKAYSIPTNNLENIEYSEIIYADKSPMQDILDLVTKIRGDDIPVIIMGETGTGKEMIARAIHQTSQRNNAPFIALNCGALSETLLESELFGHERGSFTGALARRRGRFELANRGTIFLDEITETSATFQSRLLRVLQEKTFERLGGENSIHTDVRIIAATNKNIAVEMEEGRFRADLFYRLNGFPITLPSLKERKNDIPVLVMHFLKKYKFDSFSGLSDRAMEILLTYHWPGNIRELENMIRRAAVLAQSENRVLIKETDLPGEIGKSDPIAIAKLVHLSLEDQILTMLQKLKFSHTAISQTAKALGNKDRGTITEYFKGICFEQLVAANFNVKTATSKIAGSSEEDVLIKVETKINDYLNNLKLHLTENNITEEDGIPTTIFKGLPKKFHPYLIQVLNHLKNQL